MQPSSPFGRHGISCVLVSRLDPFNQLASFQKGLYTPAFPDMILHIARAPSAGTSGSGGGHWRFLFFHTPLAFAVRPFGYIFCMVLV